MVFIVEQQEKLEVVESNYTLELKKTPLKIFLKNSVYIFFTGIKFKVPLSSALYIFTLLLLNISYK